MKKILFLICALTLLCFCLASCSCDTEDVDNVKVKFESHIEGVDINTQTVKKGDKVTVPGITLSRPGYKFVGWFNGQKAWDFSKDIVNEDITISAKWESYLSYTAVSEIESTSIKNAVGAPNQDGVIVTGCNFDVEEVVIPTTYNGKRVVGINWAFANRTKIKSVVIPDGVVYISTNAFNRCENLETIVLPRSVTVVERGAFFLCKSLKSINCVVEEKPRGWSADFNLKTSDEASANERYKVNFGYKGE